MGQTENQRIKVSPFVKETGMTSSLLQWMDSLLAEQPVRNQGRLYRADLSDKNMATTVMKQLSEGLERIDRSQVLPVHPIPALDLAPETV